LDRRFDVPQSQSGQYGEVKIFYHTGTGMLTPSVIQTLDSTATIAKNTYQYQERKPEITP
jgi:hypothetical protein